MREIIEQNRKRRKTVLQVYCIVTLPYLGKKYRCHIHSKARKKTTTVNKSLKKRMNKRMRRQVWNKSCLSWFLFWIQSLFFSDFLLSLLMFNVDDEVGKDDDDEGDDDDNVRKQWESFLMSSYFSSPSVAFLCVSSGPLFSVNESKKEMISVMS